MKKTYLSLFLFVILLTGCYNYQNISKDGINDNPIKEKLPEQDTAKDKENSLFIGNFTLQNDELGYITLIEKCLYKNQTVYFFPEPYGSSDMSSKLVDENSNFICSPSGGFEGNGNMAGCPNFSRKTSCEIIWKNPSLS